MNFFNTPVIQQLMKFGIVGASGMCIDFSVTWLCKERIRINKYIANTAGFSLAVINNFYLNYIWTFGNVHSSVSVAFGLFLLFAIIGLLLNNFLVYLFTDLGLLNFYLSKLLAIIAVFIWNFTANYFFNFHS